MKCVRITVFVEQSEQLSFKIHKKARQLGVEGTVHSCNNDGIKIIACGTSTSVDDFIDHIHKTINVHATSGVEIEPFIKERDYRGVFRIIE